VSEMASGLCRVRAPDAGWKHLMLTKCISADVFVCSRASGGSGRTAGGSGVRGFLCGLSGGLRVTGC
jgi:hypothetical protein